MRVQGACCTILESLSQFGIPYPKPRLAFKDLLSFGIILVVVTTAFGLAQQAIMFPNEPPSAALIFETLKIAYYQMYGELFLDDIEGNCSILESFFAK